MFKKLKRERAYHKDMHEHYEELFKVSLKELQAERLYKEHLLNLIEEVKILTGE